MRLMWLLYLGIKVLFGWYLHSTSWLPGGTHDLVCLGVEVLAGCYAGCLALILGLQAYALVHKYVIAQISITLLQGN